jgi:glyoxylase-like metal-dependent hydrolase (beta-lactamase superfamily II)
VAFEEVGHVNAYAVRCDDGLLLVDCGGAGDPTCEQLLANALSAAGFSVADVQTLAVTHTHSDHVGLAAWVIERSGCSFWMHPNSDHFYDAMRDPDGTAAARERRARAEGVPQRLLSSYRDVREETEGALAPVEPDHLLGEGVRLPSGLGDFEVIETPGHCPSHVILYQRERRLAITGDLVCAAFVPWYDYGYSEDPIAEYLSALDRLEGLDLEIALPGHGRPLDNVAQAIAEHREGVARRLAETLAAVETGSSGAYELTRRVFGDPDPDGAGVWQMAETICYLRHLRSAGAIVREQDDRGLLSYRLAGRAVGTPPRRARA